MKRKNIKGIIITMVLMLVMVITLTINNLNVYALTEVEDVYQISTKSDLEDFRDLVNSSEPSANAILLNDIDLDGNNDNQWTPINNYAGTFDGNGYTISNLFIDSTEDNVGLFSNGASGAVIKNLAVHGDVKTTKAKAAGIMSSASNISIINCVNMVNVSANTNAGGIVGHSTSSNLTIEKCSNYGDVHAKNENAGGIAGTLRSSVIKCFNAGNITADSRYAGGIAGFFPGGSGEPEVSNCYNIGNITSQKFVGGIVGYNYYHKISKCFNIGTLTNNGTGSDKALIGGIVSNSFSDEIENCYYLESDDYFGIANTSSDDNEKTMAITLESFQEQDSFSSWDFDTEWEMGFDYPLIRDNIDSKKEKSDENYANKVEDLIDAIGEVEYTDESKEKIDDAREGYDNLTDTQKPLVDNYDILTDAEDTYTEFVNEEIVNPIKDLIDAIGEVEYTAECKTKIDTAREAYDTLTDGQKVLVDNYDILVKAENEYSKLKEDHEAADAVDALILAIGEVEYTIECKTKIDTARDAYDELTTTQKDLVKQYSVLQDVIDKYNKLKKEFDDVKNIDVLTNSIGNVGTNDETNNVDDAKKELPENLNSNVENEKEEDTAISENEKMKEEKAEEIIVKNNDDKKNNFPAWILVFIFGMPLLIVLVIIILVIIKLIKGSNEKESKEIKKEDE